MNNTAISWTDLTWNPWSGCRKVSPECKFCYADSLAEQKRGTNAFPNGFELTLRPHKLAEVRRLKVPSLIFVNSMSDFWITGSEMGRPDLDAEIQVLRHRALDVFEKHPQHQFQVLTKRPQNITTMLKGRALPDNVWLGTTIGHASQLGRLNILRSVPARTRFLSMEPLISQFPSLDLSGVDWVITGGESGLHLRDEKTRAARGLAIQEGGRWLPHPTRSDIVRRIDADCRRQGVAHWFKQWGGIRPNSAGNLLDGREIHEFPRGAAWHPDHASRLFESGREAA